MSLEHRHFMSCGGPAVTKMFCAGGLMRRVHIRMQDAAVSDFAQYRSALDLGPEEFTRLFNTILINVTGFFRDGPGVWNYVTERVLPAIIAQSERTGRIRMLASSSAP